MYWTVFVCLSVIRMLCTVWW